MALCARDFMWELWATKLVIDWRLLRHGLRP
jgi:hypothetical protein